MLINNIKIIAQTTEPNPREVDYWINTSVDPNGGLIMFHDGEAWHPVNEHHDLFQEELIKQEVERAKAAEAKIQNELDKTQTAVGLNSDGTFKNISGKYTSEATSIVNAIQKLDTALTNLIKGTRVSSIKSINPNYSSVFATISASASFAITGIPASGREVHVIIKNTATSDVTVTLPTTSPYILVSSVDNITVPANGYAEVNAISDGTNIYLRAL